MTTFFATTMWAIDWKLVPAHLYTISLVVTMVGFLVLIVFPRQSWANFWFSGIILPALLGALYSVVLLLYFFLPDPNQVLPVGVSGVSDPRDFFSIVGLRRLFLKDGLLLAGFLDLLLMPLAVAAWMARKAAQIRLPYVFLVPCLILTFGAPGTGFVLFVIFAALGGRLAQMARFEGQPPTNTSPVFARPVDVRVSTN